MIKRLRLALLISGGGTTASAIIKACFSEKISIDPVLVVASNASISGIERVKEAGVKAESVTVIDPKQFDTASKFGEEILGWCKKCKVDLIGQYGWLPLTPANVIQEYEGKIINQHPGPLDTGRPDFGGKGMYGKRVQAAILYFRRMTKHDYWTEATTHFVTAEFDKGGVIKRKKVAIVPNDTVESLQDRIRPIEHVVQIAALADFADGKVKIVHREKPLIKDSELKILGEAKRIAAIFYPNG